MTAVRGFIKNTVSLASAELVTKILAFLLFVYIARELGDVEFGKYSFALAFALLFAFLSDIGLTQLTIREVAKRKEDVNRYFGTVSAIKVVLSILTIAIIVVVINFLGYPQETIIAVYIAGAYSVTNSFSISFFAHSTGPLSRWNMN
ncbi:oligosaccharide flippase family protein [Methanogenium marinum]|uniref:Oligosaccharide flippase family protein n=1 Tax=Methanogenium marinum TaxID=348610 RepID=A0A9Q4KSD6_9EURY|nr:oligosaccharide flippase family protein [Methanogenium marinum]MDE4907313.1 oligosaccharide flippase family protein [Methanogenium marinum]